MSMSLKGGFSIKQRLLFWICESFGHRDELKTYLGYGDFDIERGWWLFGQWVSFEDIEQKRKKVII